MKKMSNAAYELQCKIGVLIDRVEEWAYVFWVRPVYGRPYFVGKKSELGIFIEANREPNMKRNDPFEMSDAELEAVAVGLDEELSTFTEQFLARDLSMTLKHINTYHVRQQIKNLGGRWNAGEGGWDMPNQAAYNKAWDLCRAYDAARFANSY